MKVCNNGSSQRPEASDTLIYVLMLCIVNLPQLNHDVFVSLRWSSTAAEG